MLRRTLIPAAVGSLLVAMFVGAAGSAGAAPGSAGSARARIADHHATIRPAGVVDVSKLPRVTHQQGVPARSIPLRTVAGPAGPSHPAVGAKSGASPLVTATKGTELTSALAASDNSSALTPPDMGLAVGGGKKVQMVNVVGRIWTGTTAGSVFSLNSFFLAGSNFLSDPTVRFDSASGRFFAGIFDVTLGGERIAVSTSSDPGGSWVVYAVRYPGEPGGGCPDQGKLGIDSDVVGLGFNEFSGVGCTGSFLGAGLEVFNKSQMVAGTSVNFVYTAPLPTYFSLIPAQAMTASTTLWFASVTPGSGSVVHRVTSVGVPPATVTLTAQADVTVNAYASPPAAPQKGTTTKVAAGDDRVQNVVWSGGNLALALSDKCTPAGDTGKRACARVISMTDAGVKKQDVDFARLKHYYYYPSIGVTSASNIVVTFAESGKKTFPQLDAAALPLVTGAGSSVIVIHAGTQANVSGRYGDYFAVAIDPAATTNAWVAGEVGGPLSGGLNWNTAVAQVIVT